MDRESNDDIKRHLDVVAETLRSEIRGLRSEIRTVDEKGDRRFDAVDRRFDEVDQKFDAVDRRFDELERHLDVVGENGAVPEISGRVEQAVPVTRRESVQANGFSSALGP